MAVTDKRVLLTGAGEIARRVHIPYLLSLPSKPEILVRDADPAAVTRVVRDFGLTPFDGPIRESGADLAVICTPPSTHADFVIEALGLGMEVVCEKPLATSAEDAQRILDASRSNKRRVFACYTNRHRNDVRLLHEQLAAGRIGQIRHVTVDWTRRWGVPGTAGAIEAGVLWDLGSHLTDLALFLTGWSGEARAFATSLRSTSAQRGKSVAEWYGSSDHVADHLLLVDTVHGLAQIGDGVLSMRASWNHLAPSDEVQVQVVGTQGLMELRTVFGFSPDRQRVGSPCIRLAQTGCPDWRTVLGTQSRQPTEFQAQLDVVFGRSPQSVLPASTALELAVRSVSLCDAFARSLATGEAVKVCLS